MTASEALDKADKCVDEAEKVLRSASPDDNDAGLTVNLWLAASDRHVAIARELAR